MLEKSFGLLFFLKQSKNEGKKFIYQRITVDCKAVEWSTREQWDSNRWDQDKCRAIGSKDDVKQINFFLDTLHSKVLKARQLLISEEEEITAELLRDLVTGRTTQKMILEIFAQHNLQMKALVGQDFADGTLDRYETSLEHTRKFIAWQYQKEDFSIKKLDHYFIEQYAFWLKTVRKCNHNTTMKYLANFKKVVLICVKNKWLPGDPFTNFKLTKKVISRDPLNQFELERMVVKDFGNERLNNVRDIFVFSCCTGLAYADVKKLKRSEICQGNDGEQWIFTARQKTNTPCPIPLLPLALTLLAKYADHPKCQHSHMALPVLSNQKMNAYLKEIADICGLHRELTFHLARHTFATTICLSNGVPLETVSKMLGHTTLTQTQHYAKIMPDKIGRDMAQLRSKLTGIASAEPIVKKILPLTEGKTLPKSTKPEKEIDLSNQRKYTYVYSVS
jgi:site-specific recombinase XerD